MYSPNYNSNGQYTLKALLENPDLLKDVQNINSYGDCKFKDTNRTTDLGAEVLYPNIWDQTIDATDIGNLVDELLADLPQPGPFSAVISSNCSVSSSSSSQQFHHASNDIDNIDSSPGSSASHMSDTGIYVDKVWSSSHLKSSDVDMHYDATSPAEGSDAEINLKIPFTLDPKDLELTSLPGGKLFDPRQHKFKSDELKPTPLLRKMKKTYMPDDRKDDTYWARRKKNNVAAKRSREAHRIRENQIILRASYLERENASLRQCLHQIVEENKTLRNRVKSLEAQ